MLINSWLVDQKIRAVNVGLEISLGAYWDIASAILKRNDLQRRKIPASGKVYELLRRDLAAGCVLPPIILAVSEKRGGDISAIVAECVAAGVLNENLRTRIGDFTTHAIADKELIILDGLQRTYSIQECLDSAENEQKRQLLRQRTIRLEVYVGLTKMGILYRMLTLNTGQTPMTLRHQIEILYHDYIDKTDLPDGITIIRELDEKRSRGLGKYKYSDVVDMFQAYATGIPQSLDREALVGKLRELDFIESYRPERDDMLRLLTVYNQLISKINGLSGNWQLPESGDEAAKQPLLEQFAPPSNDELSVVRPFGTSVPSIFAKSQPMTGFGAECQRLIRTSQVAQVEDLRPLIDKCHFSKDADVSMQELLKILDKIAKSAKRIGDAQRTYFQFAFRHLLNRDSECHLNLSECWLAAEATYTSMFSA